MSASQPVGFVPTPAQRRLLDFVDANPNLSRQLGDVMSQCGRPLPASDARPQPDQREGGFSKRWPCHKTIQELCVGAGVPSSTYYHWCKNNDFRLWFAASWSARLTMDGVVLLNQARLLATRSFSYWKALFNLTFDPKGFAMLQQWQQTAAQLPSDAFTSADPDPVPGPTPESSAAALKRELCRQAAWSPRPAGKTSSGPSATEPRLQSTAQSNQSITAIYWRKSPPTPAQHVRTLRSALR